MYGNGRPLGMRKRIRVLIAVVLLAWATQTLVHQWGYGAEVSPPATAEKFVPGAARVAAGAALELRGEATIFGAQVKLKQICRWSAADAPIFAPFADLVIVRIKPGSPFREITVDQIRTTLRDAGLNVATINFGGPVACTITRSDSTYDEQTALRLWAQAKEGKEEDAESMGQGDKGTGRQGDKATGSQEVEKVRTNQRPAISPVSPVPLSGRPIAPGATARTLRGILMNDLSVRLGVAEDQLQVTFSPQDEKLLNMSEPLFKFDVEPRQVRDLGQVSWNVLIVTGNGSQKGVINASARAWQNEIVVAKPLTYRQVILPGDVTERRVLADHLPGQLLLSSEQVVGQEAARDLTVGSVVTAAMVDAVPLVKSGQLVNISLTVGSVRIKTVGRALESGSYGQAIKIRNETTQDTFEVVMVGPQEGTMGPLPASKSPTKLSK
jgi:flagella basal body P-ring formation protein FlgA